jgi:pectate lyase
MRRARNLSIALGGAAALTAAVSAGQRDLGRETLAERDGWASSAPGTTGGAAAAPEQVYVVTNRRELVAALNNGVYPPPSTNPSNAAKIIYAAGTIDANVDDDHQPLQCTDYYSNGYTLEAFLAKYDPAGEWGRVNPTGALETARLASGAAQQARVRIRVGSNTTIVGVDKKATIRGAWLDLRGTATLPRTNIIIRNITFQDTYDCFPQWAPNDGALGNWNSQYDSISLRDSHHVWIDHNTFEDVETADDTLPTYFGRPYQIHDGHLDITNASDLVTVSWNRFLNHDKVMLIGSSDNAPLDVGKLRVTLHHNLFDGVGQRSPRVRYGQVHVYNNLYRIKKLETYGYSWGVGIRSAIYAEGNFFQVDQDVTADELLERFNGTAIHERGNLFDGPADRFLLDLREAYNTASDPDLAELDQTPMAWAPTLFLEIEPARHVLPSVQSHAGPIPW